jgi:protein-disulfide isomerase
MKRPALIDSILNVVITAAVVAVAVVVVRRELTSASIAQSAADPELSRVEVSAWRRVLEAGLALANPTAPVRIVVFEDLECPFCKRFHETVLSPLLERYRDSLSAIAVHFPLPSHRFSSQAAQALECASDESKGLEFLKVAYGAQDSIGLLGWGELARRAGLGDTVAFHACARSRVLHPRISHGVALGNEMGITSTPTIMVNALRFSNPPSKRHLELLVDSLLSATADSDFSRSKR